MSCDRRLSIKDKESLYFWINKGIWKSQSYSGAEAALFQPPESVSTPRYPNTMTSKRLWWLTNSRSPTQLFLLKLTQISGSWHCKGFLGSLQLLSFSEVTFKKNKIKLKNTKPQASAQNEALRCSQQDGAFRVCTVQTGAMQRWLRWLGKIQRCSWIAVEKGLMCNHWTWKRLRGIHLISPHEKNHIPQPCKSYWERMKNERKDQAAFQLCPQIK